MSGCLGSEGVTANITALIPARSGSVRIKDKNVKLLHGHPLLAYAIASAKDAGIFDDLYVSTDSPEYAAIARRYGAKVIDRPAEFAVDDSPDYQWVRHALGFVTTDAVAILRPTSPFRTAATIRRAWATFSLDGSSYDSLRAVERTSQHPNKMWTRRGDYIIPYAPLMAVANHVMQPGHSVPTQRLPEVYVQNASLEMVWAKVVKRYENITGTRVCPLLTQKYEGFDLNTPEDWFLAETLIARGLVDVPKLEVDEPVSIKAPRRAGKKVG